MYSKHIDRIFKDTIGTTQNEKIVRTDRWNVQMAEMSDWNAEAKNIKQWMGMKTKINTKIEDVQK